MSVERLVPGEFYWAKAIKAEGSQRTIVHVSTIFGEEPDYWTLTVPGSDQHFMPGDFEVIALVEPPVEYSMRHAAE
ncbi:hypothetical protein C3Y89_04995 [Rhizobium sp. UPM1132]|uniref:hypothetical protein n=1 Tax=Rhizobium ruizarguesonis TaxID=2081791 RepID=UPI001447CD02|nr:hypothetical protein [Rhizobium ruizarguesonis]NKQ69747.1 hypothetical protein [Rhizobium ruizarguesonis]